METFIKYMFGAIAAIIGLLTPVKPLIVCALIFIGVDFITGVAASKKRAWRAGKQWGFESSKAWTTILKAGFVMGGIVLAWLIDEYMLHHLNLNLAKLFTGFVCGVEFWSYLENAAEISNHQLFKWLKRFMKKKLDDALDADIDKTIMKEEEEK